MGLEIIPRQPVKMSKTFNPRDLIESSFCGSDCADEPPYCLKVAGFDQMSMQMKNVPQATIIRCDTMVQPIFVTNMDNKDEFDYAEGWAYNDTFFRFDGVYAFGGLNTLQILSAYFTPVSGTTYFINVHFENITASSCRVYWGTTLLDTVSSNGIYSYTVVAPNNTDTLILTMNSGFHGSVTGIEISAFAAGWNIDDTFLPDPNAACGWCKKEGASTPSIVPNYTLVATPGLLYKITFEIRNRTTGGMYIEGDTHPITFVDGTSFFNENGFYVAYVYPSGGNTKLKFTASADFDGCIYNITYETQCRSHRAFVVDENDEVVAEVTHLLTYENDFMTLNFRLGDYFLPESCYRIAIDEMCNLIYAGQGGQLLTDPQFLNGGWTLSGNASISNGVLILDPFESFAITDISGIDIVDKCFIIQIQIIGVGDGDPSRLYVSWGGNLLVNGQVITQAGGIVLTGVTIGALANNDFAVSMSGSAQLQIESVSIIADPACSPGTFDFYSNCMKLISNDQALNGCLFVVTAGMDNQSPFTKSVVEFGFLWNNYFRITFREMFMFANSKHDGGHERYKYNNGNTRRPSAQIEKTWDVTVGAVDEGVHDSIALMLKLDWMVFYKFPGQLPQTLYMGNENDYTPNWAKGVKMETAQGKFEVITKNNSMQFRNNVF